MKPGRIRNALGMAGGWLCLIGLFTAGAWLVPLVERLAP